LFSAIGCELLFRMIFFAISQYILFMSEIPFFQVDAFSASPFHGNPAAVCILREMPSDELLQSIASENNLAETAFLFQQPDVWKLRWFTPACEVPLCGHATLAAAHILCQEGLVADNDPIRFETLSGVLSVQKEGDSYTLDFPAYDEQELVLPETFLKAVGAEVVQAVAVQNFWLLELNDATAVRTVQPDLAVLASFPPVIITSRAEKDGPYDFISRMFGPSLGIPEDPVTGSAHCCLAPYWSQRLGKKDFFAYQASARGGELKLQLKGDRVLMSGKAVTVIRGTFFL
jgi:PhzF family phenazine biosynthesis protein